MSVVVRVFLILAHAIMYYMASKAPHKTPPSGRYDTEESVFFRIAPYIFKAQRIFVNICTISEVSIVAAQNMPRSLSAAIPTVLCPAETGPSPITFTYLFLAGFALVAAGTFLRLACYRSLGPLFTFDLTLLPKHTLITSGPYGVVRHPAYLGSLLVFLGIGLMDLTPGGWVIECIGVGDTGVGVLGSRSAPHILRVWIVFGIWFGWWLAVGVRRARIEDAALKQEFGRKWEEYACSVPWWFIPHVV